MQHVIIGIIINAEQHVLIAQRLSHQIKAGFWEFPGGKVEAGETAFQALQREFSEEIGIEVLQGEPWLKFDYVYPHKHVLLDIWLIDQFKGVPVGAEGQPIRWVSAMEMIELQFPEGNKVIIEKLVERLSP
jgi:8-oxo-dGTP diphosphatase